MLAMDLLHRLRVATRVAKQMAVDCMNARPGIEVASSLTIIAVGMLQIRGVTSKISRVAA